jgi:hypothetical protein
MIFRTSGLLISIIDFTLSRINTGECSLIKCLDLYLIHDKLTNFYLHRSRYTLPGPNLGPLSL